MVTAESLELTTGWQLLLSAKISPRHVKSPFGHPETPCAIELQNN
jgi:hypothetical protein